MQHSYQALSLTIWLYFFGYATPTFPKALYSKYTTAMKGHQRIPLVILPSPAETYSYKPGQFRPIGPYPTNPLGHTSGVSYPALGNYAKPVRQNPVYSQQVKYFPNPKPNFVPTPQYAGYSLPPSIVQDTYGKPQPAYPATQLKPQQEYVAPQQGYIQQQPELTPAQPVYQPAHPPDLVYPAGQPGAQLAYPTTQPGYDKPANYDQTPAHPPGLVYPAGQPGAQLAYPATQAGYDKPANYGQTPPAQPQEGFGKNIQNSNSPTGIYPSKPPSPTKLMIEGWVPVEESLSNGIKTLYPTSYITSNDISVDFPYIFREDVENRVLKSKREKL